MKIIFRNILIDLKKIIFSCAFLFCIFATFLLSFTSIAYVDNAGKEYSVLEIIIDIKSFYFLQFDCISILSGALSAYLTIFLPILSALPFVTFFCSERTSGYIRFCISRSSKNSYYISKFIAATISGGISIMLGYVFYGIAICILFPFKPINITTLIQIFCGMALYGSVSVLPAFFLSSIMKNKYLICCFPFIFIQFYYTILSKITSSLIKKNNMETVMKMDMLYPHNLRYFFENGKLSILFFYSCLSIFAYLGFVIIMKRSVDCGE